MNTQTCGVAVDNAPCGQPAVAYQPVRPLRAAGGLIHWTGPLGPGVLLLCSWHYQHPPTDWDPPTPAEQETPHG